MNDYKFGNFLFQLREQKGMTQAQLAQMLNVTAAAVSKWENGESKPRIETLFSLAQILGVSAEELMAGERKMQQAPVSEQEEQEQKQKLFLSQTENLLTAQVRLRRLLANFIDTLIAMLPFFCFMGVMLFLSYHNNGQLTPDSGMFFAILGMPLMFLSVLALLLLRDVITKGRSLGCRATGLIVLNENTGERAQAKQLVLRNVLVLAAGSIDDLVMLITGRSLGDRVAQTITVSKKQAEELQGYINEPTTAPPVFTDPKKTKKSVILIILCWFLIPVIFFVSVFAIIRHQIQSSEYYLAAQEYLLQSKAFNLTGADAEDVACVSSSATSNPDKGDATLVFAVNGKHHTVVCHKEGDTWEVCKDCTDFR